MSQPLKKEDIRGIRHCFLEHYTHGNGFYPFPLGKNDSPEFVRLCLFNRLQKATWPEGNPLVSYKELEEGNDDGSALYVFVPGGTTAEKDDSSITRADTKEEGEVVFTVPHTMYAEIPRLINEEIKRLAASGESIRLFTNSRLEYSAGDTFDPNTHEERLIERTKRTGVISPAFVHPAAWSTVQGVALGAQIANDLKGSYDHSVYDDDLCNFVAVQHHILHFCPAWWWGEVRPYCPFMRHLLSDTAAISSAYVANEKKKARRPSGKDDKRRSLTPADMIKVHQRASVHASLIVASCDALATDLCTTPPVLQYKVAYVDGNERCVADLAHFVNSAAKKKNQTAK